MAEGKGLDLAHPGGKEILIAGGVAVVLGVVYLKMNANKTGGASASGAPSGVPASGHGLGSPGQQPTFLPAGATGNALTDSLFTTPTAPGQQSVTIPTITGINGNVPTIQRGDGGGIGGRRPGPRIDLPHPRVRGSTSQGAHGILSSQNTSGPPVAGVSSGVANLSPGASAVYNALRTAGLSPTQAAGVMGNIINESGYRVEVSALDTNNAYSYGLVQWNAASHPNASQFVTGNLAHDLQVQAAAIAQAVKNLGLPPNASPEQVAGAFASRFEVCQGCQPGGPQYNSRVANATAVWQQIQKGIISAKAANISTGGGNIPAWELKGSGLTEAQARAMTPAKLAAYIQSLFPKVTPKAAPAASRIKHPSPPPRRRAAPRGRPAGRTLFGSYASGLGAAIGRLAASLKPPPRPAPKPPTQSPHHQRFVGGY